VNIHEINVSEIIAGSKFISIDDAIKLYEEVDRLLSINDQVNIDFLGIDEINEVALVNSIGKFYNNDWDSRVNYNIKYININNNERILINKIITR